MAESASTGNSGTTGAGSQSTSTTSTSTSTSTSNGGPAASGSQTSSNGSFSTGKGSGNNGNNGVGPGLSFGAGVTSNSNGNFSGGLPGMAPGFAGFAASNFGQGWGSGNGGSSTNDNKTEPVMTVDEVYGKGNQSIVESQGDYEATSNEKSNVETSTFGKQDEISVTPVSITEDKGLVNNDAIQSVEGLNFQQKDKANQEVMEAKKSRDEAEAEDNADGMRDQLKAVAEKDAEETETDTFQVGEEASSKEKAALDEAAQAYKDLQAQVDGKLAEFNEAYNKYVMAREDFNVAYQTLSDQTAKINEASDNEPDAFEPSSITTLKDGNEITVLTYRGKDPSVKAANDARNKAITELSNASIQLDASRAQYNAAKSKYNQYIESYNEAKTNLDKATEAYNNTFVGAPTTEAPSYKANIEAARNEINNAKDLSDEQKAEGNTVLDNIESATDAMSKAANDLATNPNDINAVQQYVEETARYNKALKDAKGNNALKNTDFNKTFTKAVADANNFMVTRDDGTQQNYAEFAAEMATKSPELAKGLYEAKAAKLAEEGHKVLAAIETAKSKMVMTWLGSKFTFADNQVRSQFNQMAKTDMRATYATYNNVLNDETGKYSEAEKAEAFDAINQANSLMTASAALQASTGFLSGIGDGTSDGVYGVTDPGKLNGYQEALNAASNFAKITLGLGVTPGANEAYQNMYYLAGDKAKNSILFGRDFDGDGFALCQEYGNNAAVGMIAGAGELAVAVALMFNPATSKMGINLAIDSVKTFLDGLYGVQKEVNKSIKYSNEVLNYFNEAKSIAAETGNKEATSTMDSAIKQIEDFQLKSDEVGNLDNWLEGSGSNTTDNGKFNQALSYDEWLKLIEADPVMQEYAKSLNR